MAQATQPCVMATGDYTDALLDATPLSTITIIDNIIIIIIVVVVGGFALVGAMAVIAIRGIKQLLP
uniref:Uncharacterized protein n=1 Tax=Anopheles christyi TaxID=43041 RepID=A0A182KFY7_9DIPT